jgi:hypothetical protein
MLRSQCSPAIRGGVCTEGHRLSLGGRGPSGVTRASRLPWGLLDLDDRALDILAHLRPREGANADPRIYEVTVRHLLQHTGGWDREKSFDPMFVPLEAAEAVGAPVPASCETVIRYVMGQPLDHPPGTRYAIRISATAC